MKILVGLFVSLSLSGCFCKDCPEVPKHYEELGCVPLFHDGDECPYTYDCSPFENRNRNKCYFAGTAYDIRQRINDDLISSSCSVGCFCDKNYDGKTKFTCAHIDCPEFFGSRLGEDCIRQYKLNRCCSSGSVCGEARDQLAKCEYKGKTYYEGQNMDTEGCYSCICTKDFDATKSLAENEKSCKKINCMIDLHYGDRYEEGCVAIYYGEERCCPIPEFKCPSSNFNVVKSTNRAATNNAECKFGSLRLAVGDLLAEENDKCVTCTCKVPPYVTCIKKPDCY